MRRVSASAAFADVLFQLCARHSVAWLDPGSWVQYFRPRRNNSFSHVFNRVHFVRVEVLRYAAATRIHTPTHLSCRPTMPNGFMPRAHLGLIPITA